MLSAAATEIPFQWFNKIREVGIPPAHVLLGFPSAAQHFLL